jgi:DNA-binding XRE family transcriptional regulator
VAIYSVELSPLGREASSRPMPAPESSPPTLSRAFGVAVRRLRAERGVSQEQMALNAGIDRSYFGHIERGEYSPTLETVERVAKAFDVSPSELILRAERAMG